MLSFAYEQTDPSHELEILANLRLAERNALINLADSLNFSEQSMGNQRANDKKYRRRVRFMGQENEELPYTTELSFVSENNTCLPSRTIVLVLNCGLFDPCCWQLFN